MPRKDYPLWELMLKNPSLIKAEVHEWTDGQNQEVGLLEIVRRVISEEEEEKRMCNTRSAVASSMSDCKLQTIAVVREALPPVLPVPQ
ncbi:hypothetical protein MLD38_030746 [Melastoma candidum]|uniref:Uncharacterized protein n=1 Tax=Melastoma candidum TaxID=119954 RepID=A0ACB9MR62_9MYRT|nr:hypothetical protein MLD38_030746 [Melastoma candidum]